jgi:hypothetical protein
VPAINATTYYFSLIGLFGNQSDASCFCMFAMFFRHALFAQLALLPLALLGQGPGEFLSLFLSFLSFFLSFLPSFLPSFFLSFFLSVFIYVFLSLFLSFFLSLLTSNFYTKTSNFNKKTIRSKKPSFPSKFCDPTGTMMGAPPEELKRAS